MSQDSIEKSVEDLEKEITCAICHEFYSDPKVLPCCHYYCKQCIHNLSLRNGVSQPFSCPECRKATTLPEGRVNNLPTAFFVNRMKSMHSSMERAHGKVEAKCQMCSGDKAEAFCMQCAMFICAECVKQHQKMRVFSGHRVSTLDELREGGTKHIPPSSPPECQLHKEPFKIYCFDCSCLICRDCTIKDHRDHNYEFITVSTQKMKETLIQKLHQLKKAKSNLMQAVKEVQSSKSEVETQGQSVLSCIGVKFDELCRVIETRRKELLAEAARAVSQKLENLSAQEKELVSSCAVVQSVIDYTEQSVEHSAGHELVAAHAEIVSRIDREIEEQCRLAEKSLAPVEEANLAAEVSIVEDLKQLCQADSKITQLSILSGEGLKSAEVNKMFGFRVTVESNATNVKCQLKSLADGSYAECKVEAIKSGVYCVKCTPTVRGRHVLIVTVDGKEAPNSPFPVFVSIHPTKLGKPVLVIPGLKTPTGVGVTSSGEIVISEYASDVVMYSREGKKIRSIDQSLSQPRGVAVDQEDNIFIIDDSKSKIYKCDKLLKKVTARNTDSQGHVAVAAGSGEIMVCERRNYGAVTVYDNKLKQVKDKIIPIGTICGESDALFVDTNGRLYVADPTRTCVQVMNRSGSVLLTLQQPEWYPTGVCVFDRYIYVSNCGRNHSIVVFTTEGEYVTSFGKKGSKEGEFFSPTRLCIDKDGFLHVCEFSNRRLQVF